MKTDLGKQMPQTKLAQVPARTRGEQSSFTPGPWRMEPCNHGGGILIRGNDARDHQQSHLQIVPIEDARLIAASPDLLAALKVAAKACLTPDVFPNGCDEAEQIQAAIQKAEGQQPQGFRE